MYEHPLYGLVIPEKGWVPAPRFVLRRQRILKLMEALPKGNVIEIGCGAGTLLHDLAARGFSCVGYEASPQAYALARYVHQKSPNVEIVDHITNDWQGNFDYVLAFEVLEHIEDDVGALARWRTWLKPGGRLVLSVPAHQKRWNDSDVWAGHFRRYERTTLKILIEQSGFKIQHFECYGYPLANIIDPIRTHFHKRALRKQIEINFETARAKNNDRSGTQRNIELRLYPLQTSWLGIKIMGVFLRAQDRFLDTDRGNGYLLIARVA